MSRSARFAMLATALALASCRDTEPLTPLPEKPNVTSATSGNASRVGIAATYQATVLPLLPLCSANFGIPGGINDAGLIAGTQSTCGVRWDAGVPSLIGISAAVANVTAVNNAGDFAGELVIGGFDHAHVWSGGTATDLGTLGGTSSIAEAINDAGVAVGRSYVNSTEWHAFVWQNGVMSDLGSLPNAGPTGHIAYDINNSGVIVGTGSTLADSGRLTPFIYQNGVMSGLPGYGDAFAVNDLNVVVGRIPIRTQTNIYEHAAMWVNGQLTDLGTLPGEVSSRAVGINNAGQIVGWSGTHAFLWENGVMMELPSPAGASGAEAYDINESGEIVGTAYIGYTAPVHWTVIPPNTPPVASAGGPYTGNEGALVTLNGGGSSDPENNPLTYDWDFGDGSPHGSGVAPTHAFPDNGTYTITLTVSDGSLSNTATATATISNVAPSGMPNAPTTGTAGVPFVISLAATDPSPVDAASLQYRFNCGSGLLPVTSTPSVTCNQAAPGTYNLRFIVRDKDGASATYTRTITITTTNTAPVVTLTTPSSVTIPSGGTVIIGGVFTDAPGDAPWLARVVWGAGQPITNLGSVTPGQALSASRTFTVPGTYAARLEVKDKFNALGKANVTIVVQ